jgi:class 3 adenylate cyclase
MAATRRLSAILAADVAGYSRLIGADEPGTLQRLRAIRAEVIDPAVEKHNGRIVKTTGDGLLIEFGSTVDALRCAKEVQAAMAERNAATAAEQCIAFRIGIHQGDIVAEDGDIFGDGVNIAARLEALAAPDGICVSARVQEDAAGKLDLAFRDLGEQRLHNIARPVRAYAIGMAARPRRLRPIRVAMIGAGVLAAVVITAAWWSWPRETPALSTAQSPPTAGPAPAAVSAQRPVRPRGRTRAASVDRRPTLCQPVERPGAGIFRRRHHRRSDHRSFPYFGELRHRPQHDLHLQGQTDRRETDRT